LARLRFATHNHRALIFWSRRGYEEFGLTHFTFGGESHENRLHGESIAVGSPPRKPAPTAAWCPDGEARDDLQRGANSATPAARAQLEPGVAKDMIHRERLFARLEGDFVVFLIGMRINALWKVHRWWPVARAMPRMIRELQEHPELGMLGGEMWGGRTTILVQYWRSAEHLFAYARNRDAEHLPAWRAFNRAVGTSGDVGVWHETYLVGPGRYENIYVNMPAFALGKVGALSGATAGLQSAEARLRATRP
jgi:hypothetical protein